MKSLLNSGYASSNAIARIDRPYPCMLKLSQEDVHHRNAAAAMRRSTFDPAGITATSFFGNDDDFLLELEYCVLRPTLVILSTITSIWCFSKEVSCNITADTLHLFR